MMDVIRQISAGLMWLLAGGCAFAVALFAWQTASALRRAWKYRNSEELKRTDLETATITIAMMAFGVIFGAVASLVALAIGGA